VRLPNSPTPIPPVLNSESHSENHGSQKLSLHLSARVRSIAGQRSRSGPQSPAAEYYDLRRYQLANGPGTKLTDQYFAGALIPALNRLGIGPVGAFSIYFGPVTPAHYLLLPSTKLDTLVTADLELAKDTGFMKAAAPFLGRSRPRRRSWCIPPTAQSSTWC
jgi:hypothetical protein